MKNQSVEAQALELLQSRASSYDFLSYVYRREVDVSFLSELAEQLAGDTDEGAASEGHRTLGSYMAQIRRSNLDSARTELASEYAALFLNVGRNPVFPFESVYTSPERLLMQKARDEVLAEYRREGLDRTKDFREPEDHIAIELEFMGYLCQKAADALEAGDIEAAVGSLEKQRGFLNQHLLIWIPQFCQDVIAAARSDFYRGIALITKEHLAQEGETIAELVEVLQTGGEG